MSTGLLGILLAHEAFASTLQAAPGEVVYYKYDNTPLGTQAIDSSGNGLNGNYEGTVALSALGACAPVPNNLYSIVLNQGSSAYVDTPVNAQFQFTTPFTLCAWIYPTASVSGNPNATGAIIHQSTWQPTPGCWIGYALNFTSNNQIWFYVGTTTTEYDLTTTATVPMNAWTFVTAVWDGTNMIIYLNGAVSATMAQAVAPGVSGADLRVGLDDWIRYFYGNVDEVRLFNVALTPAQIVTLYEGIAAPTLTATNGPDFVQLNWTAVTGATAYNVLRGTTTGGPYTQLATVTAPTLTYTDMTATYPNTYYYVVQTVDGAFTSAYSNECVGTPLQVQIVITPTSLTVAENQGTATFAVSLVTPPVDPVSITFTSSNAAALQLTGPTGPASGTVTLNWAAGQTQAQTVLVTAIQLNQEGPPVLVPVNCTTVNGNGDPNYPSTILPGPVNCTIIEDTPAIIVNPGSLSVTNGGPAMPFTVQLATIPTGTVTLNLSVSSPDLATVAPATLQFNNTNWNTATPVQLTPTLVNTQTTYIAPYDIVIDPSTSTDALYAALPDTMVPVNIPVSLPPLSKTWGSCGLLGWEGLLPLVWALCRRRRAGRR